MATIFDVAKLTGFSAMTVSRVINEPEKVNEKTRLIIEEKIKELGFTPNSAAKSLASNCTNIIFVYIPSDLNASHPFVMQAVAGIGERLGEHGYSFLLSRRPYTGESCDGIIAMGLTLDEEQRIKEIDSRKPLVLFGSNDEITSWVDVDNYYGSYQMTEYMLNKGYKKIGYIGVGQKKRYAEERYRAFLDCMKAHSAQIAAGAVIMVDNKERNGFSATQKLIEIKGLDAIICSSDLLALGCIRALHSKNIAIPSQVAVSGFDGLGYEKLTTPHITTIEQPIYEAGHALADKMIAKLKKDGALQEGVYIKPKLVIHESA